MSIKSRGRYIEVVLHFQFWHKDKWLFSALKLANFVSLRPSRPQFLALEADIGMKKLCFKSEQIYAKENLSPSSTFQKTKKESDKPSHQNSPLLYLLSVATLSSRSKVIHSSDLDNYTIRAQN